MRAPHRQPAGARDEVASVYALCHRITNDLGAAARATRATFAGAPSVAPWRPAVRRAVLRARALGAAMDVLELGVDGDVGGPTAEVLARDANGRLELRLRAALALRELEGCRYAEIGALLGLTADEVAGVMARARMRLQAEFDVACTGARTRPRDGECVEGLPLIARHLDGELRGSRARRRLHEHLEQCRSCRFELGRAERARKTYSGWARAVPPAALRSEIAAAVPPAPLAVLRGTARGALGTRPAGALAVAAALSLGWAGTLGGGGVLSIPQAALHGAGESLAAGLGALARERRSPAGRRGGESAETASPGAGAGTYAALLTGPAPSRALPSLTVRPAPSSGPARRRASSRERAGRTHPTGAPREGAPDPGGAAPVDLPVTGGAAPEPAPAPAPVEPPGSTGGQEAPAKPPQAAAVVAGTGGSPSPAGDAKAEKRPDKAAERERRREGKRRGEDRRGKGRPAGAEFEDPPARDDGAAKLEAKRGR